MAEAEGRSQEPETKRFDWFSLMIQTLLVIFGVFAGLWVNDWHTNVQNQKDAREAGKRLKMEVENNLKLVTASRDYHRGLSTALKEGGFNQSDKIPSLRIFHRGFISPAAVNDSVWQTAQTTQLTRYMDYEDLLLFSSAYSRQARYVAQADLAGAALYDQLMNNGHHGLCRKWANLLDIIQTFAYREEQLIQVYTRILKDLSREHNSGAS
ncbi:hypothetical protein [Acanthopleuribacter pedis]|uniref:Uncharacterized protein n=1 Tax=Acanthopleuribacter pedis TaxID=442870 RepID=A0A8J7QFY6_9BACT|nr:hypothetical protein [Acanthopleuribacter pedis]MBO1317785.1 hypothetical protein [Acanthopleuribacter pedis]